MKLGDVYTAMRAESPAVRRRAERAIIDLLSSDFEDPMVDDVITPANLAHVCDALERRVGRLPLERAALRPGFHPCPSCGALLAPKVPQCVYCGHILGVR